MPNIDAWNIYVGLLAYFKALEDEDEELQAVISAPAKSSAVGSHTNDDEWMELLPLRRYREGDQVLGKVLASGTAASSGTMGQASSTQAGFDCEIEIDEQRR